MKLKLLLLTGIMTLSTSFLSFAEPVLTEQVMHYTYSVSENGLLNNSNKKSFSYEHLTNKCTDNDVPFTGEVIFNNQKYYFENGYPEAVVLKEDGYHFYDYFGVETEYRNDLVTACDTFLDFYNRNQRSDNPIYQTSNIRDLFTLINMIQKKCSNNIYSAGLNNLIETSCYEESGNTLYSLNITSPENIRLYKDKLSQTDEFLKEFYSIFNGNETEREICTKTNNFIKNKFDYNYEKANEVINGGRNVTGISDMASGENLIICQDYADLYKFLCELKGIDTEICYGTSTGIAHAWNRQLIDGKELYTDVTFNDTAYSNNWLLISKDKILMDHTFY